MQVGRDTCVEIALFLRNALLLFAVLILASIFILPQFESFFFRLGIPLISLLMLISGILPFLKTKQSYWKLILAFTLSVLFTLILLYRIEFQPFEYPHLVLFFSAVFTGLAFVITKSKGTIAYIGIAIVCAGSVYVDVSSEVISRTNGNDFLYLAEGDTLKMESYYVCHQLSGDELIFFERIPILYEKGAIVEFEEIIFKAVESHSSSVEFFSDLERKWSLIPYPNQIQLKLAKEWKNGIAGSEITDLLQKNLWTSMNTEVITPSSSMNDTNIIAVKVTRCKLEIVVWFGAFLVAFGIIYLFLNRNHSVQITNE
jgi:hypothetical protein